MCSSDLHTARCLEVILTVSAVKRTAAVFGITFCNGLLRWNIDNRICRPLPEILRKFRSESLELPMLGAILHEIHARLFFCIECLHRYLTYRTDALGPVYDFTVFNIHCFSLLLHASLRTLAAKLRNLYYHAFLIVKFIIRPITATAINAMNGAA